MPDWIDRTDAGLREQANVFSRQISQDPGAFGATVIQAEELAEKFSAYDVAYRSSATSFGDSTTATLEKNQTRALLVQCMRERAKVIRAMTGVTQSEIANLHMHVPVPRRTRVPMPDDSPSVTLGPPTGRRIPVRVRSTLTPQTRGLPRDVASVQVYGAAGSPMPPVGDPRWRPLGVFSRAKFEVEFNFRDIQSGDTIWVAARYANARAQTGPWGGFKQTYALGPAIIFAGDTNWPQKAG